MSHWRDREYMFHGMEHVIVVLLVAAVLLQASDLSEPVDEDVASGAPFVIIPPTDAFTVQPGEPVEFPWMVVNTQNRTVQVRSGMQVDWGQDLDPSHGLPPGMTAMVGGDSRFASVVSLDSGEHRQYRQRFRAPTEPGEYRITLFARTKQGDVTETVFMTVRDGQ